MTGLTSFTEEMVITSGGIEEGYSVKMKEEEEPKDECYKSNTVL